MSIYQQGAADERARIVWWLRAVVAGPAAVTTDPTYLAAVTDMADIIERHPERFAQAPPRAMVSESSTGSWLPERNGDES